MYSKESKQFSLEILEPHKYSNITTELQQEIQISSNDEDLRVNNNLDWQFSDSDSDYNENSPDITPLSSYAFGSLYQDIFQKAQLAQAFEELRFQVQRLRKTQGYPKNLSYKQYVAFQTQQNVKLFQRIIQKQEREKNERRNQVQRDVQQNGDVQWRHRRPRGQEKIPQHFGVVRNSNQQWQQHKQQQSQDTQGQQDEDNGSFVNGYMSDGGVLQRIRNRNAKTTDFPQQSIQDKTQDKDNNLNFVQKFQTKRQKPQRDRFYNEKYNELYNFYHTHIAPKQPRVQTRMRRAPRRQNPVRRRQPTDEAYRLREYYIPTGPSYGSDVEVVKQQQRQRLFPGLKQKSWQREGNKKPNKSHGLRAFESDDSFSLQGYRDNQLDYHNKDRGTDKNLEREYRKQANRDRQQRYVNLGGTRDWEGIQVREKDGHFEKDGFVVSDEEALIYSTDAEERDIAADHQYVQGLKKRREHEDRLIEERRRQKAKTKQKRKQQFQDYMSVSTDSNQTNQRPNIQQLLQRLNSEEQDQVEKRGRVSSKNSKKKRDLDRPLSQDDFFRGDDESIIYETSANSSDMEKDVGEWVKGRRKRRDHEPGTREAQDEVQDIEVESDVEPDVQQIVQQEVGREIQELGDIDSNIRQNLNSQILTTQLNQRSTQNLGIDYTNSLGQINTQSKENEFDNAGIQNFIQDQPLVQGAPQNLTHNNLQHFNNQQLNNRKGRRGDRKLGSTSSSDRGSDRSDRNKGNDLTQDDFFRDDDESIIYETSANSSDMENDVGEWVKGRRKRRDHEPPPQQNQKKLKRGRSQQDKVSRKGKTREKNKTKRIFQRNKNHIQDISQDFVDNIQNNNNDMTNKLESLNNNDVDKATPKKSDGSKKVQPIAILSTQNIDSYNTLNNEISDMSFPNGNQEQHNNDKLDNNDEYIFPDSELPVIQRQNNEPRSNQKNAGARQVLSSQDSGARGLLSQDQNGLEDLKRQLQELQGNRDRTVNKQVEPQQTKQSQSPKKQIFDTQQLEKGGEDILKQSQQNNISSIDGDDASSNNSIDFIEHLEQLSKKQQNFIKPQ